MVPTGCTNVSPNGPLASFLGLIPLSQETLVIAISTFQTAVVAAAAAAAGFVVAFNHLAMSKEEPFASFAHQGSTSNSSESLNIANSAIDSSNFLHLANDISLGFFLSFCLQFCNPFYRRRLTYFYGGVNQLARMIGPLGNCVSPCSH